MNALLCVSVDAQPPAASEIVVRRAHGIALGLSIDGIDEGLAAPSLGTVLGTPGGEIYRLIVDHQGMLRFAYSVTATATHDEAVLSFRPVRLPEVLHAFSSQPTTQQQPFKIDARLATLAEHQSSGSVRVGDLVRLDLFEHTATGRRVSDVIRVIDLSPRAVKEPWRRRRAPAPSPP